MNDMVSIVIPCYNSADFIEESIVSAINQTYQNCEIIVVDDGSNENTKVILKQLEPQITKLITQNNQGQSAARNCGIAAAKGRYILVLDSDDYMESQFCEKAVGYFTEEDTTLITCQALLHFENGNNRIFKSNGGALKDFLFSNSALGNCAMFKKEDWARVDGYDEQMTDGWEDWEFYIRLMQLGGICKVIPEVLFHYRKRQNSTTTRANDSTYDLYRYIFNKHESLYKSNYSELLDFLLKKIKEEEQEKIKAKKRKEFVFGKKILDPIRFFRRKLK